MILLILSSAIVLTLSVIAYQDFKYRAVSWYLFPLAFILLAVLQFQKYEMRVIGGNTGINLLLILIQFLLLGLYYSIKEKRIQIIPGSRIGLGDVLLLVVLCLGFSPMNFVVFIILALISGLLVTGIIHLIVKNPNPLIPLASYLGLAYIFIIVLEFFRIIDPYRDYLFAIII